jgi:hypothetical protein
MTPPRRWFRTCILFVAVLFVGSRSSSPQTQPGKPWLEHWRLSTFSFGTVDRDQNRREFFKVIGTGFFAGLDEKNGYIVTAKHVFRDDAIEWHPSELRMRFSWQEHKSVYDEFGTTLKLRDERGTDLWKAPDDGSDVAAIVPAFQVRDVPVDAMFARDFAGKDDVFEGASVIVIGYPGVVGNEYLVRSIIRGGIIAWTDPDSPLDRPLMIDVNVMPGNSGSPVLRIPVGLSREGAAFGGTRVVLLGLVSKGPVQQTDLELRVPGTVEPIHIKTQISGIGGIGVVVPASKIAELLAHMPRRE